MKLFGFNITRNKIESETYQSYSTPFKPVGDANLSLPYVKSWNATEPVRFGKDNLYPQLLNQLYFTSPLHSAIINFKVNATVGGGYELDKTSKTTHEEIEIIAFEKKVNLPKLLKRILLDRIVHNRIYCV